MSMGEAASSEGGEKLHSKSRLIERVQARFSHTSPSWPKDLGTG